MEFIDENQQIASQLIAEQFPQYESLAISPVLYNGHNNYTFRLGSDMKIRMPINADYNLSVIKEQNFLAKLSPLLPFKIPEIIGCGKPTKYYQHNWSIYKWIEGDDLAHSQNIDLEKLAIDLSDFFLALHKIDTDKAPYPSAENFYRGGSVIVYDPEFRQAIKILKNKINAEKAVKLWESAIATTSLKSVWVHGDISLGNLLMKNNRLHGIIDFGQMAVGDPACDLMITWTLFKNKSRDIFINKMSLDENTWIRAIAWTLWKFAIVMADMTDWKANEAQNAEQIVDDILNSFNL